ncbi:MAG: protein translocase subunit SecF [Candidatus Cloacimonetes bacterium]|nr:protein translocase subunit SecF [Candidatus Cloacimonadota bacterium]
MNIFPNPNFDFMNKRIAFYFVSAIIIFVGLVAIIASGGLKYNVDFEGGLSLELAPITVAGNSLTVTQIRETLNKNGFSDAEIQELPNSHSFLIKAKSEGGIGDNIIRTLKEEYPDHTATDTFIRAQDEVGPRAGADLRAKAVNAVLISLLFILIYIWVRFRFTWGFIAAFGLFHDVMITLVVLHFMKMEIGMTILAALLTVVGYSINNTIVIFDRIRENMKLYRKEDDNQLVNRSINDTLNRTVMMTLTTLLVNLSLLTFGGPVIFDFAFTFMVGVIAGTYSSIWVVTGIVLDTIMALKKKKAIAVKSKK